MRVLVKFGHGTELFVDEDGGLYVRGHRRGWRLNRRLIQVEVDRPMSLLPLLEARRDTYAADVIAALPIRELLTMALTWPSDYWPTLAVEGGWITDADLTDPGVHRALGQVASDRDRPQPLQHAARRVLNAAGLPRMPSPPAEAEA